MLQGLQHVRFAASSNKTKLILQQIIKYSTRSLKLNFSLHDCSEMIYNLQLIYIYVHLNILVIVYSIYKSMKYN